MDRHEEDFIVRATGRTTRIIDDLVQKLYKNYGEWITVYDHYPNHEYLKVISDKVLIRMSIEHKNDVVEKRYYCGEYQLRLSKCGVIDYKREELKKLEKEKFEAKIIEEKEKVNKYR